jgi:hypothetical protein
MVVLIVKSSSGRSEELRTETDGRKSKSEDFACSAKITPLDSQKHWLDMPNKEVFCHVLCDNFFVGFKCH